jgi:hypothetical protein
MPSFPTPTDLGPAFSALRILVDDVGDPRSLTVEIALSDGRSIYVELSRAEAAAALTTPEQSNVRSALPKLYAAAVAKAGGV